ncbi:MGMT family protein [Corynebacterium flavescens]
MTLAQPQPPAHKRIAAVLSVVRLIPAGNLATYGEVGKVAGCGARYVGWVLGHHAGDAPWWRVVNAQGKTHAPARVTELWEEEGIAYRGERADLSRHGLDAEDLREMQRRG